MTPSHRRPLISPTAGLRVVWAVIRFFLVSYALLFGKAARRIGAARPRAGAAALPRSAAELPAAAHERSGAPEARARAQ